MEEQYYIDRVINLYRQGCHELVLESVNGSDEVFIECRPRSADSFDVWVEDLDGVMKYGLAVTYGFYKKTISLDTLSYYTISDTIKPILDILQKKIDYQYVIKSLDLA